jgi:hypothetical protein
MVEMKISGSDGGIQTGASEPDISCRNILFDYRKKCKEMPRKAGKLEFVYKNLPRGKHHQCQFVQR